MEPRVNCSAFGNKLAREKKIPNGLTRIKEGAYPRMLFTRAAKLDAVVVPIEAVEVLY